MEYMLGAKYSLAQSVDYAVQSVGVCFVQAILRCLTTCTIHGLRKWRCTCM